jgi:hypothetical protein
VDQPQTAGRAPTAERVVTDGTADAARNVGLVRRFIEEGLNRGDPGSVVKELFAPEYVGRLNGDPMRGVGPSHPLLIAESLLGQYPDLRVVLRDAVAAGDWVAGRFEITLTHAGTGRAAVAHASWFLRVAGAQFVEGWLTYDTAPLLRAAGYAFAPPDGAAEPAD